jgi:hypothetical protein
MVTPAKFDLRGGNARHVLRPPLPATPGNSQTVGAGGANAIPLAADVNSPNVLSQIIVSLSVAAAGILTIIVLDGATEIFRYQIPAGVTNPPGISFDPPLAGTVNSTMTVTLSAPGGAVVSSLTINAYTLK